jgi:triosephosphate isomerase
MRSKLVVGNWKMHGNQAAIAELIAGLQRSLPPSPRAEVAVCPPFVYLPWVRGQLPAAVALGAQNVSAEPEGAFTGEIAAGMLQDVGCRYVIVGHSERRSLFGETDELVARKAESALAHGLIPIVCVGETLAQREQGTALAVIGAQLDAVRDNAERMVIAYEPVWAIGTGRTATPEQAQEVHAFIRERLNVAEMKILYGGSVKADNAAELFKQADIDGALVGGAALNAEEFAAICRAAE